MRFRSPLLAGTLVRRYKRFFVDVKLRNGRVVTAHCPNSGSLRGCKVPVSPVRLSYHPDPRRSLKYTWEMIRVGKIWVGVNTLHPNRLVEDAITRGVIRELQGYDRIRREVRINLRSRLDLCLERGDERCYVEVKNVTLEVEGAAAFPDAITERGTRHLRELIRLKRKGYRSAVVFVVQRADCVAFRPADEIDPVYGRRLRQAALIGVEILAYQARVTHRGITLCRPLPLIL